MQAFTVHQTTPRSNSRRLLIPAAGILLLGGAAFVAAGGVGLVRSWLVTTKVDGQVVDVRTVTPNEDGSAQFTVPLNSPPEGTKTIELAIDGEPDGPGAQKTVNVTLHGDKSEAQIEVKAEQSSGGE